MALIYRLEDYTPAVTVDLIGGDGKADKLTWRSFDAGDGRITEVFVLSVGATTRAGVRSALNSVVTILERARQFHRDPVQNVENSIWLHFATDGESAKRALIYDYALEPLSPYGITPALDVGDGRFAQWQLAITRDAEWESVAANVVNSFTISANGGDQNLTAEADGQADQRVSLFTLASPSATFNKFWFGFHRLRDGAATDLSGVVDITGAYSSSDTTIAAETGSVNGDSAQTTFSAWPDWKARAYAVLATAPDYGEHYIGRWLVLLRAKTDSATACMVRASISAGDMYLYGQTPIALTQGPEVYLSSTEYHLYEMGEFQIPPYGRFTGQQGIFGMRLNVEARRAVGTGKLYADAIILIPADHLLAASSVEVATGKALEVVTGPDFKESAVAKVTATQVREAVAKLTTNNWRFPKEGAVLVAAFERSSGHVITDTGSVTMTLVPRWIGYHD
jgi:hypothetical protein